MAARTGRPLVVVVGSINVDLVVRVATLPGPGETVTGGSFSRHHGGKGANQAVAASRMGAHVRFIGAVGDDSLGAEARAALKADGVDVSWLAVTPGVPSGVALIIVDDAGENQIAIASGANATLDAAWVRAALLGQRRRPGVMLLNLEIGDEPLSEAASLAAELGLRLVVNPAPARELPAAVLDGRPILLPNAGEAMRLAGSGDVTEAARTLAARTGEPVVVTLGRDGALIVDDGSVERVPAYPVEAVDTTGAGDTVCGVLAAELAGGALLRDATRTAMAAAAMSVTVPGARGGMPDRAAVERLLARAAGRR